MLKIEASMIPSSLSFTVVEIVMYVLKLPAAVRILEQLLGRQSSYFILLLHF